MINVITYGTFDTLHYGHIYLLMRARAMGDHLTVGLSTDAFHGKKKKTHLYHNYEERKHLLQLLRCVDRVVPEYNWEQKTDDIELFKIKIFVMGDDWEGKFDILKHFCKVYYLPRTPEISTTLIKDIINK